MATVHWKSSPGAAPFEVGVFHTAAAAERAIRGLRARGFIPQQIAIITADRSLRRRFREYRLWIPAANYWRTALSWGAGVGFIVGTGIALGFYLYSGWELITAGVLCMAAGTIVGGLVGVMLTRGQQLEPADYYEQAVPTGELLVAVEQSEASQAPLEEAAAVFREAGARPVELRHG